MFPSIVYVLAIVAANLLVAEFGPWFSIVNSFVLIGLDLSLRDLIHDRWAGPMLWPRMLGLIALSGLVSFALNPASGIIAVASVVAFCLSSAVDAAAYQLASGRSYLQRSNFSNLSGALVDSVVFPTVAFGALLPGVVTAQFASKLIGGLVWSVALWRLTSSRRKA
jgi:hypothetical protein